MIESPFGLGRLAPFNREQRAEGTVIRLFWSRIAVWALVLFCAGWMSLATGLFVFVKYRRGFSGVRFSQMLFLPWTLDDYWRAKGEFFIREGLAKAEAQEWRGALDLLRPGLLAVPEHREARLMVARIYLMAGRADMTRTILIEGLKFHGDELGYLREVLGYFFGLQADDTVIELTDALRGRLTPGTPAARMATTALAYAFFNRARYMEAEATLSASRLLDTPEGRFVVARIAWARGRHDQALAQLGQLTAQVPDDIEIYRTLIHCLKEEKRWAAVQRASLLRQFALPERPEAYVDFIEACGKAGEEARRANAVTAFFGRFTDDPQALLQLGELASDEAKVEIAGRVAARCRALGRYEAEAVLVWMGAKLEGRDYRGVVELWDEFSSQTARWPERHQILFGGLHAVALYGLQQGAEAASLTRSLSETKLLSSQSLAAMAIQLQRVGQGAEARRVLRHAAELDPLNQPALVQLLRGMLADGQLQEALPLIERLRGVRNPPEDLLADVDKTLDSDLYLFLPGRERIRTMFKAFLRQRIEDR